MHIRLFYLLNFYYISFEGEISVKSCLPNDYTEVLHLCSDNDGICRGTLRLTVIPFVRFIFICFALS